MIKRLRSALQARVDAIRDRPAALRSVIRSTLRKAGDNHVVHLASLASLFSRIIGMNVTCTEALAAVSTEFPNAIYYMRKRCAPPGLRLRVVGGVRVRTSMQSLCEIVQGHIEAMSRPKMRHARANRNEVEENRIGVYRGSCNWGKYPPQHRVVFEDWATTKRHAQLIATAHGMRLDSVRAILTHHKARAGVIH